eukprot:1190117-Prorocentrum_minimum.AAC.2
MKNREKTCSLALDWLGRGPLAQPIGRRLVCDSPRLDDCQKLFSKSKSTPLVESPLPFQGGRTPETPARPPPPIHKKTQEPHKTKETHLPCAAGLTGKFSGPRVNSLQPSGPGARKRRQKRMTEGESRGEGASVSSAGR